MNIKWLFSRDSSFRISLGVQLILAAFVLGCSSATPGINTTGNPSQSKNGGMHSPSVMNGGLSLRVLWTVSEYKMGADAVLGKKEADELLFKPLNMDANSITFSGKKCSNVTFKKETVAAKEYFEALFHISPEALSIIDKTVEVIKTDCNLPGFGEFVRLSDRQLVLHIKGVFFFLKPAVAY